MALGSKPTPGGIAGQLATKEDLKAALDEVKGTGRIQGAAMAMVAMGLAHSLSGCGQQQGGSGGGHVDIKLELGESPMPHEPKGDHTLDVKPGDTSSAAVILPMDNDNGRDFGV